MTEKKLIIPTKKFRGDSTVLSIRVPNDMVQHLDEFAERTGRTRSEIIQMCLEFSVEHLETDDQ